MRRSLLLLLALAASATLFAVPATRVRRMVTLTDGTRTEVILCGDEHASWWQTADGQVLAPAANGRYVKARRPEPEEVAAPSAARRIGSQATAPLPAQGSPRVPVVLVNFQDSTFHVGQTDEDIRAYYDLYCNGTRDGRRYTGHGSYGSIRDYFAAQSDSLFLPEFVVIGPVTLDKPEEAYGRNNGSSKDTGFKNFRNEAVTKAIAAYEGDWADFDNRGKNQVDMVFFIFAGCGENTTGIENLLWPKESPSSVTAEVDGRSITIASSACCSENRAAAMDADGNVTRVQADGIGVMCHELGHALGLPDFYDTSYKAFGMDVWSLMDYGCYMVNGFAPVAFTAYERDFMGWRALEPLTDAGQYTLAPIAAKEGRGLKVVNPENENEYYILEARLASGWDTNLARYGHGLQVTHVDYQSSAWNTNRVNTDAEHQRMTIIAANNRYLGTSRPSYTMAELRETWAGNLYPFEQNDSLTALSVPAATVFSSAGYMPHTFTQIAVDEEAKAITFWFDERLWDAVSAPRAEADAEVVYDLQGRRHEAPVHPGIYVVGGRKKLIR